MSTKKAADTAKVPYCIGKWLPSDQALVDRWLENYIEEVDGLAKKESNIGDTDEPDFAFHFLPSIQSFNDAVESNPELSMFFHQMFAEIPGKQGPSAIRNYNHMLYLLNHVLTIAPQFDPDGILVAIPMFAILRKPVFTVNGYAAFLNSTVNEHLKMGNIFKVS